MGNISTLDFIKFCVSQGWQFDMIDLGIVVNKENIEEYEELYLNKKSKCKEEI